MLVVRQFLEEPMYGNVVEAREVEVETRTGKEIYYVLKRRAPCFGYSLIIKEINSEN